MASWNEHSESAWGERAKKTMRCITIEFVKTVSTGSGLRSHPSNDVSLEIAKWLGEVLIYGTGHHH